MVDHLASNGLLQSLAVFLPESGLGSTGATAVGTGNGATAATAAAATATLSREDVLQALPIPADSALFRRVISRAEEGGSNEACPVSSNDDGTTAAATGASAPGAAPGGGATAVVVTASTAVSAAWGGGSSSGGGARGSGVSLQQRRVCGLLEALVGEVAARSRAVAVDSNTQTEEAGRSHKENLGELGGVCVCVRNGKGEWRGGGRAGAFIKT